MQPAACSSCTACMHACTCAGQGLRGSLEAQGLYWGQRGNIGPPGLPKRVSLCLRVGQGQGPAHGQPGCRHALRKHVDLISLRGLGVQLQLAAGWQGFASLMVLVGQLVGTSSRALAGRALLGRLLRQLCEVCLQSNDPDVYAVCCWQGTY